MKLAIKTVLSAYLVIGLCACQIRNVSDQDSSELLKCTVDEVLEHPFAYEGKTVLVTGVMPHSGIQNENGEMMYPLYDSDMQGYIVLSDASDPMDIHGQEGIFRGTIHVEDEIVCLKTE